MYDNQQQTRPYGSQQASGRLFLHHFRHGSAGRGPLVFAVILGLAALAVGAASITLLLTYKSASQAQIRQLQAAVSTAEQGSQASATALARQATEIRGLESALATVAQFSSVCSQDLTGPNGPAQFDFMCKLHP